MTSGEKNGEGELELEKSLDQIYRAIASLEVSFDKVAKNQDAFKTELRTIAPRVDAVAKRLDVLSAEIEQLAERVHRTNNIMQVLIDDGSILHQAQQALSRALDVLESNFKAKAYELEGANVTLERMLEVVEERVRTLRAAVAEAGVEARSKRHPIPAEVPSDDENERTKP